MKTMVILLVLLLAATPSGAAHADEDYLACSGTSLFYAQKAYVFVFGGMLTAEEEKSPLYRGVEFPLYVGYLTIRDGVFRFTKKTHLPVTQLTDFFDKIEKKQVITQYRSPVICGISREDLPPLQVFPANEHRFKMELYLTIESTFPHVFWVAFTGEPDEAYEPVFVERCTFNAENNQFCSSTDFKTREHLLLVPTSNTCKARKNYNKRETFYEEYDPETGIWHKLPN